MPKETQCILGNGPCPKTCPNYKYSDELTKVLGDNFDPERSRAAIVFADVFDPQVNVVQIDNFIAGCVKENNPVRRITPKHSQLSHPNAICKSASCK